MVRVNEKVPDRSDARQCFSCGAALTFNDIGAYKKFVNRGASTFCCQLCLCQKLKISHSMMLEKIEYFKEQGCTLFV